MIGDQDWIFLQAILRRPDDDTPRLIYADWLEEQGDLRSELIRLQCELAALPAGDPAGAPLTVAIEKLLPACEQLWRQETGIGHVSQVRFDRGFVSELRMLASFFVEQSGNLFRSAPMLSRVTLVDPLDQLPQVAAVEGLNQLKALGFEGRLDLGDVYTIGRAESFSSLSSMEFHHCQLGEVGARELGRSKVFPTLQNLTIGFDTVRDAGAVDLTNGRTFPSLQSLALTHCQIGALGVRALANAPRLGELRSLVLNGNRIDDGAISSLAVHSKTGRLEELDLADNAIGDAGAEILANTPHLVDLRKIDLRGNRIGSSARTLLRQRFQQRVLLEAA